ncbi:MAG TPA: MbnP family protein [Chitinophagales bacterium]|nr:MbnP family protein [Chitinophagales bacterium]
MRLKSATGIFLLPVCCVMLLLFSGSCKKSANSSVVVLNIYNYFGPDSVAAGAVYQTDNGTHVSLNRMSYYLSGITLLRDDNTYEDVSGTVLVTAGTSQYILGSVPPGNYKSVSFTVGLNSSVNHSDPSSHTGNDPLANQTPSMHFGNDSMGYIFMAVEGLVDTTGSGTPQAVLSYHIGSDALLQGVSLPDHSASPYGAMFVANGNKVVSINLQADYKVLMQHVDVKLNPVTNTYDFYAVADSLAGSIPSMFRYLN